MEKKVKVGIIGCGTIADVYMTNLTQHYQNVELAGAADLFVQKAQEAAEKFQIKAYTVEELLADPEIQLVLDLTIPAAHYSVNKQILEAGKHCYCEKPLALRFEEAKELAALAAQKNLMCVAAPDTFLGAGLQQSKAIIDSGVIGEPIGFTANMTCAGHDLWHPNPGFYYKTGGGPMFDMGPYYLTALVYFMGPIKKISCYTASGRPVRNILGVETRTEVPTTYTAILEFVCGAIGTMTMSFDTWSTSLPLLEVYGTKGSVYAPDPDSYNGPVIVYDGEKLKNIVEAVTEPHPAKIITMVTNQHNCQEEAKMEFPENPEHRANMRGLGVSDMAQAILDGRESRMSTDISVHVVEALNAFEESAKTGSAYIMQTSCKPTAPMGKDWALWEVR
ncbi:MAG: Gfo/Idh/MocA family oxidoreductase [Parasporobacterium sp.]|nr:Gfo/Idh/MocA family oxidoreductase [Parasporobacterium sp.]